MSGITVLKKKTLACIVDINIMYANWWDHMAEDGCFTVLKH